MFPALPYNQHHSLCLRPSTRFSRPRAAVSPKPSEQWTYANWKRTPPSTFHADSGRHSGRSRSGPAVIAELKKASPSRGLIRQNFDAERLAKELEEAGAAALSVLTDEEFFQGSLDNLQRASASTRLPCLRKDFMVDEFQCLKRERIGRTRFC